jgi:phytoene synthase
VNGARRALVAHARRSIGSGSRSFALASRLFDRATRERVWMLYAWCRHCDDVVDGQSGGQGRRPCAVPVADRLAELEARTTAAVGGETGAVDAFGCLAAVARETGLPRYYAAQHLAGFAMDAADRSYRRIEDTLDYCYHVAGVVGAMMAVVMGVRADDDAVIERAIDLGLAFQLTNIARDVHDDAAIGRCYLPAEWLADAGIPPGEHIRPEHRAALAGVVGRLLDLADDYYRSARAGAMRLPWRSAWAVLSAADIYRAIGGKLRAAGSHAWDTRQHTTALEKLAMVWSARGEARGADASAPMPARSPLWTKR